jgi:hypothetical protein
VHDAGIDCSEFRQSNLDKKNRFSRFYHLIGHQRRDEENVENADKKKTAKIAVFFTSNAAASWVLDRILQVAHGFLRLSFDLFAQTLGLLLFATDHFAGLLLDFTSCILDNAFDLICIHDYSWLMIKASERVIVSAFASTSTAARMMDPS